MNSGEETCKKCGSIFRMTYTKTIMRDKDSIDCEVCGERLKYWSEAKIWDATLIEEKNEHK